MFKELIASYDGFDINGMATFYFWGVHLTPHARNCLGVGELQQDQYSYLHVDIEDSTITYEVISIDPQTGKELGSCEHTLTWKMEILK